MVEEEKHKQRCSICGYEWASWKENPKQCPHCKRMDWRTGLPRDVDNINKPQPEHNHQPQHNNIRLTPPEEI